jgi:Tfp pilus assembly PilM family ATPase
LNLRRLLRQPLLTVAFHEREVRWTVGRTGTIASSGHVPLPPGMVNDGLVVDSQAAGIVLREAPGFAGNGRMQVAIALPAQRSVFRQLEIPILPRKQFNELVEREIRRELPTVVENAYVSWQRTGERDGKALVFIVGVARDVLDSHTAAAWAAGLHPQSADLRIIAAARAVGAPDSIIAHVEDLEVELGVFRDGIPWIIRNISMTAPCGEPGWIEQLNAELGRTLKYFRDSHREDTTIDGVPVSFVGGSARYAVMAEQIGASTGHAVAMPTLRLSITPEQETAAFASNIGLALKGLAA